jgi:serine/threonine protein kinase
MTFDEALAALDAARTPADLFGTDEPGRRYRRLARRLHPDTAPAGATATATAAFARLAALWAEHEGRGATVLTTGRHRYTVGAQLARGDLATLYRVRYAGGEAVLKLTRRPADNDLTEHEVTALRTLAARGDDRYRPYVPTLVESFAQEDAATGARRTATVLGALDGFVTLAAVAGACPDGVDPRDVAWMWRRLLVALGYAHRAGVVHGAVLPDHVMIHPEAHGLVLVDWCYSTTPGGYVPALVERYRAWYPPEVPGRAPAGPATDIYLATECVRRLMGPRIHPRMLRFAQGCTLAAPRMRPQDAWRLLAELDDLLADLYGPRTFRPFALPV